MVHELKTWREQFQDIWWNRKTYELRKDDRGYEVGDTLVLQEYDKDTKTYTGKSCMRRVTSLFRGPGFGLEEGYVIMSIKPL